MFLIKKSQDNPRRKER